MFTEFNRELKQAKRSIENAANCITTDIALNDYLVEIYGDSAVNDNVLSFVLQYIIESYKTN
jgi:hypothetical protein